MMIEISGQERKLESFIDAMRPFGIIELVRTGRVALVRSGAPSHQIEYEEDLSDAENQVHV